MIAFFRYSRLVLGAEFTMRSLGAVCCFCLLLIAPGARADSPDDILVIANRKITASSIDRSVLKQLFLRKRVSWSGVRVVPLNMRGDTAPRERFRKTVLNMTSAEEKRYWQERKIRGEGGKPAEFRNVLKAVFKIRGAISYISRSRYREGVVKVLLVIPAATGQRAPLAEPGSHSQLPDPSLRAATGG